LEKESITKYKNEGWTLLNTRLGGQFGGSPLKYSDDDLKNIASNYSTRIDFKNGNSGAYQAAHYRNIIPDITKHMVKHSNMKYSYDDLKNTALKYNRKIDFKNNDPKMFEAARYRGILQDITQHMKK